MISLIPLEDVTQDNVNVEYALQDPYVTYTIPAGVYEVRPDGVDEKYNFTAIIPSNLVVPDSVKNLSDTQVAPLHVMAVLGTSIALINISRDGSNYLHANPNELLSAMIMNEVVMPK